MNYKAINKLFSVIKKLISPTGCQWCRKQSPINLCDFLLEETYELIDAIQRGEVTEISDELGDVFYLLFFISKYYEDKGTLSLNSVLSQNIHKMIRRHPKVFNKKNCENGCSWVEIKQSESVKKQKGIFTDLPNNMPPLLKTKKINSTLKQIDFELFGEENIERILQYKFSKWRESLSQNNIKKQEEMFGEILFAMVEYGRQKGVKANSALQIVNTKFLNRFARMERTLKNQKRSIFSTPREELKKIWEKT